MCVSEILSEDVLQRRVEDWLHVVDEMLRKTEACKDPHWCRYSDLRNALVDVLRAVKVARQHAQEKRVQLQGLQGDIMTKYFNAMVQVIQTKTVQVQVAADSESEAIEIARRQARLNEPGYSAGEVTLTLLGETELRVGSRVVHRIFGPGVIEMLVAEEPGNSFRMQIKFDRGDIKHVHGPGTVIRPEGLTETKLLVPIEVV